MGQQRGSGARRPGAARRTSPRPAAGPQVRGGRPLRRRGTDGTAVRARLTGRAAILVLVVAALLVSYASSMRANLEQRRHIDSLEDSISESQEAIAELKREKRRWRDDAYVEAQARARFAFGYPGEIGYHVLDEDGQPLDPESTLDEPEVVGDGRPEWWESTLSSIETAEHPADPVRTPADHIAVPDDAKPGR